MKKKHFYSHVIHLHDVYIELDDLEIEVHEKEHLISLMDSTVHHTVIDTILTELHEEDKHEFMNHLHKDDHDELWKLLKLSVFDIEKKIIQAVEEIKKDLKKEIKTVKGRK